MVGLNRRRKLEYGWSSSTTGCRSHALRSESTTECARHFSTWATTSRWWASTTRARNTRPTAIGTCTTSGEQNWSTVRAGSTSRLSPSTAGDSSCTVRAKHSTDADGHHQNCSEGCEFGEFTAVSAKLDRD